MLKKKLAVSTIACVTILAFTALVSAGQPYVAEDFPPAETILKVIGVAGSKILGKIEKDNEFTVVIKVPQLSGVFRLKLIRLDTNLWISRNLDVLGTETIVLEK